MDKNTIIRHHLLEIILWPTDDGNFIEIHNSKQRLIDLGVYNEYKCTITMTNSEHGKLHGKHLSPATKQKMSESAKKRRASDETKHKMSLAHAGANNHFYGKKHTEESRLKMSKARKGKHFTFSVVHRKHLSEALTGKKNFVMQRLQMV